MSPMTWTRPRIACLFINWLSSFVASFIELILCIVERSECLARNAESPPRLSSARMRSPCRASCWIGSPENL